MKGIEFIFTTSGWYILLCIALGALYSWYLYKQGKGSSELSAFNKNLLIVIRAVAVFVISFLLLSPLIRLVDRKLEKPIIVLLQDNSLSIVQHSDSLEISKNWGEKLNDFKASLGEDFDVQVHNFAETLSDSLGLTFNGKETNISGAVDEINSLYTNRNVGSVVLISDGVYNRGANPIYTQLKMDAPLYCVGMGDSTIKRDATILNVNHNQLAYLNNTFPIEINIESDKLEGLSTTVFIEHEGKQVSSELITYDKGVRLYSVLFKLKAEKPGIQKYRVGVRPVEGEYTSKNNYSDIFIEVLDARQKILILSESPHPDVFAIRSAIQSNENYDVEVFLASDFNASVKPYSLVILHQLPSKLSPIPKVLSDLKSEGIPVWSIAGSLSSTGILNTMGLGVNISNVRNGMTNQSFPKLNNEFSLFGISEDIKQLIPSLDPLNVLFANFGLSPGAHVLLTQKIGNVDTGYPLLVFQQNEGARKGVLLGDGLWQWRMQSFALKGTHTVFDEFISKIIQFLSIRAEKKNFRVVYKSSLLETESIIIEAEAYNPSFELINDMDVSLTLKDSLGKTFPYTFSKTSNAFRLELGKLKSGAYSFEANTNISGKVYTERGRFLVKPVELEYLQTRADFGMLTTLAIKNGGQFLPKENLNDLIDIIKNREDVKPVSYSEIQLKELIQLNWLFLLIFALLAFEWFIRRRSGGY